jgi:SAM-dependent methyltransferase
MPKQISYPGAELELFASAINWKSYWCGIVLPFLGNSILEVGAGLGANTSTLAPRSGNAEWVCIEPDPVLCERLAEHVATLPNAERISVTSGVVSDLPQGTRFDTILYLDTLEHIPDDQAELQYVEGLLRPRSRLIILPPAHQHFYSPFDAAIGHYRRYNERTIAAALPKTFRQMELLYLDSFGLLLSLANRLLLRQSMPTAGQIRFWDRVVVPISKQLDPLMAHRVGKSLLGIWSKVDST